MKRMTFSIPILLAMFGSVFSTVSVSAVSLPNPASSLVVSQADASAQANCKKGNGSVKTESRKVGTFTSIDVSGGYDVEVVVQQAPSLVISGESNILPQIITEIKGSTLFIYNKGCISTQKRLKLKITSKQIQKISAAGANKIKVSNLNNQTFNIAQSGGAKTELFGKTKQIYIKVAGAGDVSAQKLYSQQAKVEISGAGNVNVFATESLNAKIVGVGVIKYYGKPKTVTKNIVGVGSIIKVGP